MRSHSKGELQLGCIRNGVDLIDCDTGFGACAVSLDDFADLGRCVKSNPGLSCDHVLIRLILISLSMAGAAAGERSTSKRAEGDALCLSNSADYPKRELMSLKPLT